MFVRQRKIKAPIHDATLSPVERLCIIANPKPRSIMAAVDRNGKEEEKKRGGEQKKLAVIQQILFYGLVCC